MEDKKTTLNNEHKTKEEIVSPHLSDQSKESQKTSEDKSDETAKHSFSLKDSIMKLIDMKMDKENDYNTIESIKADVDFRGAKLYILIFAIFIASLGLNVNSTAVIIGAMLISPLMGPIIGFGLGLGISDFQLIRRSFRNLMLTTIFSVLTATIYFLISPITQAQSELLARTQPTIYDVLIAFFGGAAGIVAASSKSKGQVIPGVAIATALMPPLCTAGYGLATGQFSFFFGAFYLYIINSVFIALATFIFTRILHFPTKIFVDKAREKRVQRIVITIVVSTIIPSIYLSYTMIRDSYTKDAAIKYVTEYFNQIADTQMIDSKFNKLGQGKYSLDVILLGPKMSEKAISKLQSSMTASGVKDVQLNVKQGFGEGTDVKELKNVLLKDMYENSEQIIKRQQEDIDSLKNLLGSYSSYEAMEGQVNNEVNVLFPTVKKTIIAPSAGYISGKDSVLTIIVESNRIRNAERQKIETWLKARTKSKYVRIIVAPTR